MPGGTEGRKERGRRKTHPHTHVSARSNTESGTDRQEKVYAGATKLKREAERKMKQNM